MRRFLIKFVFQLRRTSALSFKLLKFQSRIRVGVSAVLKLKLKKSTKMPQANIFVWYETKVWNK